MEYVRHNERLQCGLAETSSDLKFSLNHLLQERFPHGESYVACLILQFGDEGSLRAQVPILRARISFQT